MEKGVRPQQTQALAWGVRKAQVGLGSSAPLGATAGPRDWVWGQVSMLGRIEGGSAWVLEKSRQGQAQGQHLHRFSPHHPLPSTPHPHPASLMLEIFPWNVPPTKAPPEDGLSGKSRFIHQTGMEARE